MSREVTCGYISIYLDYRGMHSTYHREHSERPLHNQPQSLCISKTVMYFVVPRNSLQHTFGATFFLFGSNSISFDVLYQMRLRRGKSREHIGRDFDFKKLIRYEPTAKGRKAGSPPYPSHSQMYSLNLWYCVPITVAVPL